jgi:hypothetical protein
MADFPFFTLLRLFSDSGEAEFLIFLLIYSKNSSFLLALRGAFGYDGKVSYWEDYALPLPGILPPQKHL